MNKLFSLAVLSLVLSWVLSACSLPSAAPSVTQHDLGGVFPLGTFKSPVLLRSIQVSAQPLVATIAMQYREASQPTRRGSYALNRWAAVPSAMVESAMIRQLTLDGSGRCRLHFSLAEFIVEVGADGSSRAVLAADASLIRDGVPSAAPVSASSSSSARAVTAPVSVIIQSFDIAVPMREAGPAAGAMALRDAVRKLAESSAAWLATEPARACKL